MTKCSLSISIYHLSTYTFIIYPSMAYQAICHRCPVRHLSIIYQSTIYMYLSTVIDLPCVYLPYCHLLSLYVPRL